eukprot:jgi/Bigna1/143430/aug1.78_g18138
MRLLKVGERVGIRGECVGDIEGTAVLGEMVVGPRVEGDRDDGDVELGLMEGPYVPGKGLRVTGEAVGFTVWGDFDGASVIGHLDGLDVIGDSVRGESVLGERPGQHKQHEPMVGEADGALLVGEAEGLRVGNFVGSGVGNFVGVGVGNFVGTGVGNFVGTGVGNFVARTSAKALIESSSNAELWCRCTEKAFGKWRGFSGSLSYNYRIVNKYMVYDLPCKKLTGCATGSPKHKSLPLRHQTLPLCVLTRGIRKRAGGLSYMVQDCLQGFLRSVQTQLRLLRGQSDGAVGRKMVKDIQQRLVVSLSCLCYLIPSVSYFWSLDALGGYLYLIVTVFSVIADGNWAPLPYEENLRLVDKWTASSAGVYTFLTLASHLSPRIFAAAITMTLIALYFLKMSRDVGVKAKKPGASRHDVWRWVWAHSAWHLVSAVAVAAGAIVSSSTYD